MMVQMRSLLILLVITTAPVAWLQKSVADETKPVCTFSEGAGGQLVTEGKVMPSKLVTFEAAGGAAIKMDVTCSQPAKLLVSPPIQVGGPEFKPVSAFTTVTTATGDSTKSNEAPLALPAGTTALSINLYVDKGNRLKVGNYQYTFKFTVID